MAIGRAVMQAASLLLACDHAVFHRPLSSPPSHMPAPMAQYGQGALTMRLRGGGVPKFFMWLSERYPLINQDVIQGVHMPEIDNLYLDMNGIIHPCTHGNSEELVDMSKEDMFVKIFAFLDQLVNLVQPKKMLFLAVDGVAPRAKMNQQRARRFKAAKNLEEQLKKAKSRKGKVPKEPFDSNCITPGTDFMLKLSRCLAFYVQHKISTDAVWRVPTVIISGHEVPGEGEHKIMEYIRRAKSQPGYFPNLRHCIYGNDADLIMLSLAVHEPHFVLLRQKDNYNPPRVRGGGRVTLSKAEKTEKENSQGWQILHISILRDYLDLEFQQMHSSFVKAGIEYNLERLVDDFVLLCYFVGNDFLPHLPALDIRTGGLNAMMRIYKRLLPSWKGYMTNMGEIHLARMGEFLQELGKIEKVMFLRRAKLQKQGNPRAILGHFEEFVEEEKSKDKDMEDAEFEQHLNRHGLGFGQVFGGEDEMEEEEMEEAAGDEWKKEYYSTKLELREEDKAGHARLRSDYVHGIVWCYFYYYRGCVSWTWFYPHHYSPLASDLTAKELQGLSVTFELGDPFQPFQQLLAVLPAASAGLLPSPYSRLMTDSSSSLARAYPSDFKTDMDGKNWEWEGVVLIPFLNETLLKEATQLIPSVALSKEEQERNVLGRNKAFRFDVTCSRKEESPLPSKLPPLIDAPVEFFYFEFPDFPHDRKFFLPLLCPGVQLRMNAPSGFPTLFSLPLSVTSLEEGAVDVFGRRSRRESLCLRIGSDVSLPPTNIIVSNGVPFLSSSSEGADRRICSVEELAKRLVGKECHVSWPYWTPAVIKSVVGVSSRVSKDEQGTIKVVKLSVQEQVEAEKKLDSHRGFWSARGGVDIGKVLTAVEAYPLEEMQQNAKGGIVRSYAKQTSQFPLQLISLAAAMDKRLVPLAPPPPQQRFSAGKQVIVLGGSCMGCVGRIVGQKESKLPHPSVTVEVEGGGGGEEEEHFGRGIIKRRGEEKEKWIPERSLGGIMNLRPQVISRMLSTFPLHIAHGEKPIDIALNVKFERKGLFTAGYARKQGVAGSWEVSQDCLNLLKAFKRKFPELFAGLERQGSDSSFLGSAVLPAHVLLQVDSKGTVKLEGKEGEEGTMKLEDYLAGVREWLLQQPHAQLPLLSFGSKSCNPSVFREIEEAAERRRARRGKEGNKKKIIDVSVNRCLLPHTAGVSSTTLAKTGEGFVLGDRVVNLRDFGPVPFGLRGTVVETQGERVTVLFDEPFLGGSNLHGRCVAARGAEVEPDSLLSLSKAWTAERMAKEATRPARGPIPPIRKGAQQGVKAHHPPSKPLGRGGAGPVRKGPGLQERHDGVKGVR